MRRLPVFALGAAAAVTLAGAAIAAGAKTHVMNVPLPDGSVAHIEYVGDVAPKVILAPPKVAAVDGAWAPVPFPSFAGFDRMFEEMNRQTQQMMRQVQQLAKQPAATVGTVPNVASFGNAPAGVSSYTVTSVSNGRGACTRTTEVVSQGAGKPPKVTSNVSGDCAGGPGAQPPAPAAPQASGAPIDHT